MAKTEQKTLQTLDLYLSAFLSLSGIPPNLELNNGKVVFTFPVCDDLYKLMMNYNCLFVKIFFNRSLKILILTIKSYQFDYNYYIFMGG